MATPEQYQKRERNTATDSRPALGMVSDEHTTLHHLEWDVRLVVERSSIRQELEVLP
jgi:hypothetical protein